MIRNTIGFALKPIIVIAVCISSGALALGLGDRSALWRVVDDLCVPMQKAINVPLPCLRVDAEKGFAVIRAPMDKTRILIVPTRKIEGIESPALLEESAPNLWALAWNERDRVIAAVRRPLKWSDIAMAINSKRTRTQDQLHIHVDCASIRLKRALAIHAAHITTKWTFLDLRAWSDQYRVKRIGEADLDRDIFKMIAEEIPGARSRMGLQSIAVVGFEDGNGARGFLVLVNSNGGHAEELLDHSCSIGQVPSDRG